MKVLWIALLLISLLGVIIKLFTFEATSRDDPTVSLVLHLRPSFESHRVLEDSSQLAGARVLVADENGFMGLGVYRWIVRVGWWVFPIVWLALGAIGLMRTRLLSAGRARP